MKFLARYCVAPVLACCIASAASAAPILLSVNINVWHGFSPSPGSIGDPTQMADPSNPLTSQTYVGFFSYTGPINFSDSSQATDLMSNFIPGIGLPTTQMSAPTFNEASLFEFTFILPTDLTGASITHDDGISLFDITTSSSNLIPGNEGPTSATTTALPSLVGGHNYELWYVAANGAPSTLIFDAGSAVPEMSTWASLVVGFGALGFATRRRRNVLLEGAA
ncbi:hypothetical protein [Sphingomonas nostoxanthinifaciens]|uniref:hypothetical protein n=1 Tax=Sphingomonas nostoxanthinifaciens TaxID=2872652 RepID=UPI001CC1FF6B|nr:hypothetical protein [Sphingomonas nostoxanthinifaciens]UAK24311.1 hypothetical protein K8P63_18670 [Sphingomonas nostoxanthinifaciens]